MPGTFIPILRTYSRLALSLLLGLVLSLGVSFASNPPLCLFVASYSAGEVWTDGVERGLRTTLADKCEVASFYLETHRYPEKEEMKKAARSAFELARDLQPDIIITSDDNAAKYLIVPYLVGTTTPVVFAGINWTVREYGFPAKNVTGMVEVAPLKSMLTNTLNAAVRNGPSGNQHKLHGDARILFIGSDNLSEKKMLFRLDTLAKSFGTHVDSILVKDFDAWLSGFKIAQNYDLVIIGNKAGIQGWDDQQAERHAREHTRALSVTYNDWMLDYSVLGYTRMAEEQGEWAGLSAMAILNGLSVSDIPIVTNRKVETWVNMKLLSSSGLQLSPRLINRARKFY